MNADKRSWKAGNPHEAARPASLAQVGSLLYRQLAVGRMFTASDAGGLPIRDPADSQSALQL